MLILSGICLGLQAQVEVSHQADWFYIEPGTDVHIKGSLISLQGNSDPLSNLGGMYISDSITCDGSNLVFGPTPDTVTANVYLNGSSLQTFTGSRNMRFGNVHIQNSYDSLRLENTVEVYNLMRFDAGNIDLNGDTLDLLNTGRLEDENNDRRIFGDPYGRIHFNRPLILGTTYGNLAGIGLGLTIDGNLGTNVDVWRGNDQQVNVSNGSIDRYYFFNPQYNGAVSSPSSKYWDSNELHGNDETKLGFYLSQTSGVNWTLVGGASDTTLDIVNSDSSLTWVLSGSSALTLAESDCDTLPYIDFPRDTVAICGAGGNAWLVPNGISGMSSQWNVGSQNQDSIQVTADGTYSVTITDVNGCPNMDSVVVVFAPVPVANFHVTPVCIGDTSQFQNQSSVTSGTMSYFWDLNDVYTSNTDTTSATNPFIIYSNPGNYLVNLTVTTERGCTHSTAAMTTILPYPVSDFSVANHCEDSILTLVNNSSVTPQAGLTYHWDFGNGDTSIVATPSYAFSGTGNQSITLEATSNGCTSSINKPVTIHPNPIAAFTTNTACLGNSTVFGNSSTIAAGNMSYFWELSQGNNSTLRNPTFTYSNFGTQNVTLTASSNQGCVHDTTIAVQVNALPQPSFTANATCQGDLMSMNNLGPATSNYDWDFDGQGQSSLYNPNFVFNTAGPKLVQLIETDLNGCIDSVGQMVISKPAPFAAFSVSGNCEGEALSFLNTTSTPFGQMTYDWDFGDLNTSPLASPMHSYAADGTYQVELIAENDGCFDTLVQALVVDSIPLLNLGGTITTCDSQYVFDAGNAGSTYLWSNSSTAQQLTATYSSAYWVEVVNAPGCIARDSVQLTLNAIVTPQLGSDSTFCNMAMLDAGYPGATFQWSTGANTQTISPITSGLYWVEVTDQNSCVGRDSIQATVVAAVQPNLGQDLDLCEGTIQTLDPVNLGNSYLWNSGASTSTIAVNTSGLYWVALTDANGCVERDSVQLTFHPNPILNLGPDSLYCDAAGFDLTQPNTTYVWSNGLTSAIVNLTTSGNYSVVLTDDSTGCQSSDSINIQVSATPIVNLGADSVLCSGADLLLDAGNQGLSFAWNVGGTQQTLLAASSGLYAVAVTSATGCIGTDSIDIVVRAPINTELGDDFTLCQGQTVTVHSPIFSANYAWFLDGNQLSNTDRTLLVSAFGAYSVIVTDSIGCVVSDTIVALQTGSAINAEFLVSTTNLYAGDTLQFVNLSYPGAYTSYWSFGDGAFSIDEDPQHVYFAAGDYVATLQVDNGVCVSTLSKNLTIVPKVDALPPDIPEIIINDFAHTVLYPNPNNGNFTLEVSLLEEGELYINCVDLRGKVLFQEHSFGKDFHLEYKDLKVTSGIYLLNLRVSERSETIKFIKR